MRSLRVFTRSLARPTLLGAGLLLGVPFLAYAQDAAPAAAPVTAPATAPMRSWTTFKGDPQRTGASSADVKLPLSLQWRFSSEAPARSYQVSPLVIGAPGRQRVVFGAGKNVYGLDMETGEQKWKSPDLTSNIVTPVTLVSGDNGDLIVAGQQSGKMTALRASDGGRAWEVDALSSIANAGPVVANTAAGQRIIVAVNSGKLLAFDFSGQLDKNWQVTLGRSGVSPTSSMSLSNDGTLLFICASDSKLYAIDVRSGALAYSISLAATSSVTPIVAGDNVIVSNLRVVSAYKATGGASQWNFDPRGEIIGSPSVGRDVEGKTVVYFGTRSGSFYGVDDTGAQKWKTDFGEGFTGSPLVLPSMVVCGTSNGILVGFDPANGAVIWQYRLKTERIVQVQATTTNNRGGNNRGGRGGFGGGRGGFGAGRSTTTNRIWGVSSSPTAVNGQLLLLGDNAALYSFTSNNFDAAPPRVVEPSLAVPDEQNQITSLSVANANLQIPGRGPVYFAAQLDDTGSGIDPKSIQVTLDDVVIPAAAIDFQVVSGVLTVTLLDPKTGGVGFPDGLKNMNLIVKDYAGNTQRYSFSFLVDNTATAPRAQRNIGPDGGPDGGGLDGGGPNVGGPDGGGPDGGGPDGGLGGGPDGGGPGGGPGGGGLGGGPQANAPLGGAGGDNKPT